MVKRLLLFIFVTFVIYSLLEAKGNNNYTYSQPRKYNKGGTIYLQNGYIRNYNYTAPHLKTYPDQYEWNNLKPRKNKIYRGYGQ